jgi:hypothetical protein
VTEKGFGTAREEKKNATGVADAVNCHANINAGSLKITTEAQRSLLKEKNAL